MKILVTGSSGTIGTHLCMKLLEKGHEVVGTDWQPNKWQNTINDLTIIADLRDASALSQIPTDVECIVHLAANARVYDLVENPDRAMDNFTSTYNAIEFARKNNIPRFIFASSRETYGNIEVDGDEYTEDLANFMHCESPYTASKIGGEALVEAYKRCYDLETIIIRFSNVYGMYDESDRVVPLFYRKAIKNEKLTVFGKEKCLDFTYIDDAVNGVILGIEKWDTAKNGTYNIAFGEGTTILHLADRIKEILESESEIEVTESRTGEVTHYIASIKNAKETLGYDPKVSFEEGITKSMEWYKANT